MLRFVDSSRTRLASLYRVYCVRVDALVRKTAEAARCTQRPKLRPDPPLKSSSPMKEFYPQSWLIRWYPSCLSGYRAGEPLNEKRSQASSDNQQQQDQSQTVFHRKINNCQPCPALELKSHTVPTQKLKTQEISQPPQKGVNWQSKGQPPWPHMQVLRRHSWPTIPHPMPRAQSVKPNRAPNK